MFLYKIKVTIDRGILIISFYNAIMKENGIGSYSSWFYITSWAIFILGQITWYWCQGNTNTHKNQKLNVKKADETNINYHSIYMHTFYNVHYHCSGCIAILFMNIYNEFLFFLFLHTNKKSVRKGAFSEKKHIYEIILYIWNATSCRDSEKLDPQAKCKYCFKARLNKSQCFLTQILTNSYLTYKFHLNDNWKFYSMLIF